MIAVDMATNRDHVTVPAVTTETGFLWMRKAILAYFAVLPVLWLIGLTLPLAFVLIPAAIIVSIGSVGSFRYSWPWYLVGVAQLTSTVVNWAVLDGAPSALAKHLLASYVSGWFLLGAAI